MPLSPRERSKRGTSEQVADRGTYAVKMILKRDRECGTTNCTLGRLTIDGEPQCYTLEDLEREVKIHGETAIPVGVYEVIITPSARFKRNLPLLVDVPNFSGVRIHPGNSSADTGGCILVGDVPDIQANWLGASRNAFNRLFPKIQKALETEKVYLEII